MEQVEDPCIMLRADHIGVLASLLSKEKRIFLLWATYFLVGNNSNEIKNYTKITIHLRSQSFKVINGVIEMYILVNQLTKCKIPRTMTIRKNKSLSGCVNKCLDLLHDPFIII